jgi:hypothetical protein
MKTEMVKVMELPINNGATAIRVNYAGDSQSSDFSSLGDATNLGTASPKPLQIKDYFLACLKVDTKNSQKYPNAFSILALSLPTLAIVGAIRHRARDTEFQCL